MANELPYFRFTVQAWQNGRISIENYQLKGVFIEVCGYYWIQDCSIALALLKRRFKDAISEIDELINLEIIKHDDESDMIEILFLDEQFKELGKLRKSRKSAGSKGGKARSKAQANLKQSSSYKDKIDKDKDKDKDKSIKGDHFFQDSEFFKDKSKWFESLPVDWSQAKKEHYWTAAEYWSSQKTKNKKKDWPKTVIQWDRNEPWKGDLKPGSTRPQTENQRLNDIARNGGHLKTDEKKWVQIRGKITQGEFELDGEGNLVMYCGRETLKVYPNDGFRSNVLYDLKPGNTIQEVHQYLLSERKLQIAS